VGLREGGSSIRIPTRRVKRWTFENRSSITSFLYNSPFRRKPRTRSQGCSISDNTWDERTLRPSLLSRLGSHEFQHSRERSRSKFAVGSSRINSGRAEGRTRQPSEVSSHARRTWNATSARDQESKSKRSANIERIRSKLPLGLHLLKKTSSTPRPACAAATFWRSPGKYATRCPQRDALRFPVQPTGQSGTPAGHVEIPEQQTAINVVFARSGWRPSNPKNFFAFGEPQDLPIDAGPQTPRSVSLIAGVPNDTSNRRRRSEGSGEGEAGHGERTKAREQVDRGLCLFIPTPVNGRSSVRYVWKRLSVSPANVQANRIVLFGLCCGFKRICPPEPAIRQYVFARAHIVRVPPHVQAKENKLPGRGAPSLGRCVRRSRKLALPVPKTPLRDQSAARHRFGGQKFIKARPSGPKLLFHRREPNPTKTPPDAKGAGTPHKSDNGTGPAANPPQKKKKKKKTIRGKKNPKKQPPKTK